MIYAKEKKEFESNEYADLNENTASDSLDKRNDKKFKNESDDNNYSITPYENSAFVAEHKLHYDIYYEELKLFYQKTTIFTTIQLGLFTGVILKYDELSTFPWLMFSCLLFLIIFSVFQLLVSIRGNHVNNAIIETIASFEQNMGFSFLNKFQTNVSKGNRIKKMNFPSLMIVCINILFIFVWIVLTITFAKSVIPENASDNLTISIIVAKKYITYLVPLFSCLFAVTMKVADLLDEHGMRFFKGADILFGVLWGFFGALLCLTHTIIANVILAMMMGFVVRRRLDYANHIIAFIIVTTTFFLFSILVKPIYFFFLFAIIFLGVIKDMKYKRQKVRFLKIIEGIYLYIPVIYAIPSLIYSILYNDWMVFVAFFTYDFTYNITRLVAKRSNWYKDDVKT